MNTKTTTTAADTAPAAYRGFRISPTRMQQVAVPAGQTWKAIQAVIGGHTFDVVGCAGGIDLYVDDEGAVNGSPFNLPLTIIAHRLGHPAALFGDALALSRDDDDNTRALTEHQVKAITDAINTKPSSEMRIPRVGPRILRSNRRGSLNCGSCLPLAMFRIGRRTAPITASCGCVPLLRVSKLILLSSIAPTARVAL